MERVIVESRKKFALPHTYVMLFGFMLVMAALTYVLPAGQFVREEIAGRTAVIPGSYEVIASNRQSLFDLLKAIPAGFAQASDISFFLFITGGSFAIINETGTIGAAIGRLVTLLKNKEAVVIPLMMLVMGLAGATIGLAEETIVLIAIGITLSRALGFDSLVGVAMINLGAAIGFYSGFMNPFSVGVAQGIAELPTFSGIGLRLALFFVLWVVTSLYVVRYAKKVKADPATSLVYETDKQYFETKADSLPTFDLRHALVLLVFVGGFSIIGYGVFTYGWFIPEIAAVFLGMGLLSGLIGGMRPNEIADTFVIGAKDMVFAAIVVGLARGILVVMENGLILDTIIHFFSSQISKLPSMLSVTGMYITQILINFVIPSGSGQAAATMPLMVPLADTLKITRQTSVLAFQLGDGFLDSIMPTSGILIAQLAIARISYGKWAKFLMPLMITWLLIGLIFLLFAHATAYGPF